MHAIIDNSIHRTLATQPRENKPIVSGLSADLDWTKHLDHWDARDPESGRLRGIVGECSLEIRDPIGTDTPWAGDSEFPHPGHDRIHHADDYA